MNKYILLAFLTLLLVSCDNSNTGDEKKESSTQKPILQKTQETNNNELSNLEDIIGKYASEEGDLEVTATEGMVLFNLLVVSDIGRTGDLEGEMILYKNTGIYKNKSQDCSLQFNFSNKQVKVTQEGSCEMGMGVTATGIYKSMSGANAASVIGKVDDSLGSLFYGKNESIYKKYCIAGMEEESGKIICRARERSGKDSHTIVHIFSGAYSGPDGELPPFDIAKKFKISLTR